MLMMKNMIFYELIWYHLVLTLKQENDVYRQIYPNSKFEILMFLLMSLSPFMPIVAVKDICAML